MRDYIEFIVSSKNASDTEKTIRDYMDECENAFATDDMLSEMRYNVRVRFNEKVCIAKFSHNAYEYYDHHACDEWEMLRTDMPAYEVNALMDGGNVMSDSAYFSEYNDDYFTATGKGEWMVVYVEVIKPEDETDDDDTDWEHAY